jgi:eukaryotic-like serine/threonine-protein kinase
VVLYELLTGHRPYHLLSAAMNEIARVISEEEPTRPSDVVATTEEGPESDRGRHPITPETVSEVREGDPNRLRKRLRGDLDSILLTNYWRWSWDCASTRSPTSTILGAFM